MCVSAHQHFELRVPGDATYLRQMLNIVNQWNAQNKVVLLTVVRVWHNVVD
jgi:hypothetical protein